MHPHNALTRLISDAEAAAQGGHREQALRLWEQVLTQSPDEPRALNAVGNSALGRGEVRRARQLLTLAAQRVPHEPAVQFNLAMACRADGDLAAAVRHFDLALAADPYFVQAMFQKGLALEGLDMPREAALTYKDLLDCAPAGVRNSPQFQEVLNHARAVVRNNDARLERAIRDRFSSAEGSSMSTRVRESVGALVGRHPVYVQKTTFLHVSRLPAIPFFDRSLSPWIDTLEAAAADIRGELQALQDEAQSSFEPYIEIPAGQPKDQWAGLDRSLDWSAFFFWRHGRRVDEACERCPRTAAVLDAVPMARVPRRAPNAFFSVLRPGASIPPHTGVTNMRSVVHLPLVVPADCGFRVGAETRQWEEGKAWIFDDTIEHEAWNRSPHSRAVLIFDTWNPLLEPQERVDLCTVVEGFDAHYGRVVSWQDGP